jgi:hypothetical protein
MRDPSARALAPKSAQPTKEGLQPPHLYHPCYCLADRCLMSIMPVSEHLLSNTAEPLLYYDIMIAAGRAACGRAQPAEQVHSALDAPAPLRALPAPWYCYCYGTPSTPVVAACAPRWCLQSLSERFCLSAPASPCGNAALDAPAPLRALPAAWYCYS